MKKKKHNQTIELTDIDGTALLRVDRNLGQGLVEQVGRRRRSMEGLQVRFAGADQLPRSRVELLEDVLEKKTGDKG